MKFSSLQENLKQGLSMVGHLAGKNINLPILNNILIEARDGNIKMVTTNLEIGIVTQIRGKVDEDGSLTVDAKVLGDCVSLLPNQKIDIKNKDNNLVIETDNHKTKIAGLPAEDFPLIPAIEKNETCVLLGEEFKKALSRVIFATANSETRMELTGIFLMFINNTVAIAATDSYRLAEKTIKIKQNTIKEGRQIILPAKTAQELIRILSNAKNEGDEERGEVMMYITDNQVMFTVGNTELVSRLIEGQYPDYKQIIPKNTRTKAVVAKDEMLRATKISSLFSRNGINDVNLDFPKGKNQAVISASSGQGGENITEILANVQGDDNGIVINYRYLLDGLNNIDGDMVRVEVVDSNTPCVLKSEKEDNYLYIIMPIKQ